MTNYKDPFVHDPLTNISTEACLNLRTRINVLSAAKGINISQICTIPKRFGIARKSCSMNTSLIKSENYFDILKQTLKDT